MLALSASHETSACISAPSRSDASMNSMASRFCGSFGHGAAGEHRHSTPVGWLRPAAAGKDQVRGEECAAGNVGMDDGQAVAERRALECREVVVARRAGRWSLVENRQIGL